MSQKVVNQKWSFDRLKNERKDVLTTWETGAAVNLTEAVKYQRRLSKDKVMVNKLKEAKENEKL